MATASGTAGTPGGDVPREEDKRIHELLFQSRQTIDTVQALFSQATAARHATKHNCAKMEMAHSKLDLISAELSKLVQVVNRLAELLRQRDLSLEEAVQMLSKYEEVLAHLDAIFEKLNAREIDPALVGEKGRTLFDYVDIDSVNKLRAEALKEINELKSVRERGRQMMSVVDRKLAELLALFNASDLRVDHRLAYATEKTTVQLNELNAMSAMMLSVQGDFDRVRHMTRNEDSTKVDVAGIERRTQQFPDVIPKMRGCLQRVQTIAQDVEARAERYNSVFSNAVRLFRVLEVFGTRLQNNLMEFDNLQCLFEERRVGAVVLFEELSNLCTWYNLFYTAYDELLFEIDRRHKEMTRQMEIVQSHERELQSIHTAEERKRNIFFEYYGRYLPPSLCPAIQAPAPSFELLVDNVAELPVLGELPQRLSELNHGEPKTGGEEATGLSVPHEP